jgi:hypothetical protein
LRLRVGEPANSVPAAFQSLSCKQAGSHAEKADRNENEGEDDEDFQEEGFYVSLGFLEHLLHVVPYIEKTPRAGINAGG